MKTKTRRNTLKGLLFFVLTLSALFCALFASTATTASAATYTSPTFTTSGSYDVGNGSVSGYMDKYRIYMHASSVNGSISRNAPKIVFTENTDGKKLEITVTESADKESNIQTLEILKSTDNGETWRIINEDDYGNAVSTDRLFYAFRTSGIYRVIVTDEFRTGIDSVTEQISYVQPEPSCALNGVENGGYTNGTVSFVWTDEATVVVRKNGEVIEYASGNDLSDDGIYTVTFENFDGYKATYSFTIDTVNPVVKIDGANNGETVNRDVKVIFTEDTLTAELFKDGSSLGVYLSDTAITESGSYALVVRDLAGNKTEVTFGIDKYVDFAIDVNSNGLANSVTVIANESVSVFLTRDGEEIEYILGETITVPAKYTLVLTDKLGNVEEIFFEIVKPLAKSFSHNFDDTPGFEKVLVNGEERRLNYGTLELLDDGIYEVGVVVNGKVYNFTVTVDGTAPTLTLTGAENGGSTKGSVALSDLSEKAEMKVYKNNAEISYTLGDVITEEGVYKVILTDECGNVTEYTFEILHSMNSGAVSLIIIGIMFIAGIAILIVLMRKKGKFGKKKA